MYMAKSFILRHEGKIWALLSLVMFVFSLWDTHINLKLKPTPCNSLVVPPPCHNGTWTNSLSSTSNVLSAHLPVFPPNTFPLSSSHSYNLGVTLPPLPPSPGSGYPTITQWFPPRGCCASGSVEPRCLPLWPSRLEQLNHRRPWSVDLLQRGSREPARG